MRTGRTSARMFIILDEFEKRGRRSCTLPPSIATEIQKRVAAKVLKAQVNVFPAPAVPGLGRAGGRAADGAGPWRRWALRMLQGQTQKLVEARQPVPGQPAARSRGGGQAAPAVVPGTRSPCSSTTQPATAGGGERCPSA